MEETQPHKPKELPPEPCINLTFYHHDGTIKVLAGVSFRELIKTILEAREVFNIVMSPVTREVQDGKK